MNCDDAISREAALSVIDGWYEQNRDTENIEDLIILITYMQSVQPSRRKGHWIKAHNSLVICSECNRYWDYSESRFINYCPMCGAELKGDTDADSN